MLTDVARGTDTQLQQNVLCVMRRKMHSSPRMSFKKNDCIKICPQILCYFSLQAVDLNPSSLDTGLWIDLFLTKFCRSESVGLPRIGHTWHWGFLSRIARSGRNWMPCWEATPEALGRSLCCEEGGLPPTESKELRPSANSCVREPSWKYVLHPWSGLQMAAALGDVFRATSWAGPTQITCSRIPDPHKTVRQ